MNCGGDTNIQSVARMSSGPTHTRALRNLRSCSRSRRNPDKHQTPLGIRDPLPTPPQTVAEGERLTSQIGLSPHFHWKILEYGLGLIQRLFLGGPWHCRAAKTRHGGPAAEVQIQALLAVVLMASGKSLEHLWLQFCHARIRGSDATEAQIHRAHL